MDEYVRTRMDDDAQAVWVTRLDSGVCICMDDGRPGVSPTSAWMRLASRLERTGERIDRLWLEFRSHKEENILPAGADGYYFSHASAGILHEKQTLSFFLIGALTQGVLMVQRWKTPELILLSTETRDVENAGERLIRNYPKLREITL